MLMVGRESINCHPEVQSHICPSLLNHLLNFGYWKMIFISTYAVEIVIFNLNALAKPSLLKAAEVWHDFNQVCVKEEKWHVTLA